MIPEQFKVNDGNFQSIFRSKRKSKKTFSILFTSNYSKSSYEPRATAVNRALEQHFDSIPPDMYTDELYNLMYVDSFDAPRIFTNGFGVTKVPLLVVYKWDEEYQDYVTYREELPSRILNKLI